MIAKTPLSIEEMNRRMSRAGFGTIELGEAFPVHRIAAVIGEDFQLSASVSQKLRDVFSSIRIQTSGVDEQFDDDQTLNPIGITPDEW